MSIFSVIQAVSQQQRPLTIAYVVAGFPGQDTFAHTIRMVSDHCDIIEIGVPFSDPVADGPVAERIGLEAVKNGINLRYIFETLRALPHEITSRLVLVGYYNTFLQYGFDRLAESCAQSDITGIAIHDMPIGEDDIMRALCPNLHIVPQLSANTASERVAAYAKHPAPYAHLVPAIDASGAEKALERCAASKERIARQLDCPVAIRFDFNTLPQSLKASSSAAFYESSLLDHIEQGKDMDTFFKN